MTDAELLGLYRRHQRRRGYTSDTIIQTHRLLRRFARGVTFADATVADVEDFLDGHSPRTMASYLSHLRSFYGWAVDRGHLLTNPAAKLERPKLPRLLPRPARTRDLERGLRRAEPRTRAWLALAGFQGLRCCEIARLRREDIAEHVEPPVVTVRGKGGKERVLPLHPEALRALRLWGLPRYGWVFPHHSGTGRPVEAHNVSHRLATFLHSIGSESTGHSYRHWFGTETYRSCRDLRLVQELLGHADPATTAGYAALVPGRATSVVRSLSATRR